MMLKRDQLMKIMLKIRTHSGKRFMPLKECKEKTVIGAIDAYAHGCFSRDILGILDTSFTGSGKTGFLLSTSALYGSDFKYSRLESGGISKLPLNGLCRLEQADNKDRDIVVSYLDGKKRSVFILESDRAIIWKLLNEILKAYQSSGMHPLEDIQNETAEKQLKELAEKAENGDDYAQYEYAISCYRQGDKEKAFYWCLQAAEHGHVDAQFLCGQFCYTGEGTRKSLPQSFKWYKSAAEGHSIDAIYNTAFMYENGIGVVKDLDQALFWYEQGAARGSAEMQYRCGEAYLQKGDLKKTYMWFKMAAEQGNPDAAYHCGLLCEEEKQWNEAFSWYKEAANESLGEAVVCCGRMLFDGRGTEKNTDQALSYYKKAAALLQDQSVLLDEMLEKAKAFHQAGKMTEAVRWYKTTADLGNAEAAYRCGEVYEKGEGTAVSRIESVHWYRIAAKSGYLEASEKLKSLETEQVAERKEKFEYNKETSDRNRTKKLNVVESSSAGDLLEVARYYYSKAEYEKSLKKCRQSANQGNAEAAYRCGMFYYYGIGTHKDLNQAFLWYRTAAGRNYIQGQYACAECYAKGEGIAYNLKKALYWYKQAARQGDDFAQHICGRMYYYGEGTARDAEKALYWYRTSMENASLKSHPIHREYSSEELKTVYQKRLDEIIEIAEKRMTSEPDAMQWYEMAAWCGSAKAQLQCGLMYARGVGTPIDFYKARRWLSLASEQSDDTRVRQQAEAYLEKIN